MTVNAPPTSIKCAIIGSGNIGTDLMYKALRSESIDPIWMVGIDPSSEGLARARALGLQVTSAGVDGLLPYIERDGVQIAFDATSAYVHVLNARKLSGRGVLLVDLTPAGIGPYCVPSVNLQQHAGRGEMNVNMISCGGQATIPIVFAISRVQPIGYAEIVATVASKSAGPGTRKNIDEFTRTTASGIEMVGNARAGKAIIILNPAEPPLVMRDTVHCLVDSDPDQDAIRHSVDSMITDVQRYVPGYLLKNGPVFDGRRVSIYLEVSGLGEYLPRYAGNLDIMTASAVRTAEMFAEQISRGRFATSSTAA